MCSPTERMRTPDRNTQCANYCARLRGYTLPTSGRSTGQLCKRAESASDTAPIPLTDAVIASEHTWQSERRRLADLRFKAATWIQLSHAKPHCGRTHSDFRMRWEDARRWNWIIAPSPVSLDGWGAKWRAYTAIHLIQHMHNIMSVDGLCHPAI